MSVALVIQLASRMYRIRVLSVACLALPYFNKSSLKWLDFREKVREHKMSVFIFCVCLKQFSFQEELSEMLSYVFRWLHVKYVLFLSDFNELTDFLKILEYKISWKIHPVGAEFFHTDRRMDRCVGTYSRSLQFCECVKKL
jgi:hypothetical protein